MASMERRPVHKEDLVTVGLTKLHNGNLSRQEPLHSYSICCICPLLYSRSSSQRRFSIALVPGRVAGRQQYIGTLRIKDTTALPG